MDSFMESLNRLKEAHEKEVLGLQNKLLELNSERCRDAQRVEELFTKNHQLREQQKALKENLRVLENRLRAGLCDRCMVTQELARKKQLELESAHLQSLQHLCVLTNEMNGLKEENKTLKEEVKRLQGLGDKSASLTREGTSDPPSPLSISSPGGWKGAAENPLGAPEEAEEDQAGTGLRKEEKPASHKMSPLTRISPGANMSESRTLDMSPQCISNQLHSTVAVVRPGSRACPMDYSPASRTPPPPSTRSSPPSPTYEHGLDSFLRASRPSAMAYESLKRSLQADRLCLLNRHLSLRLRSPHGSSLAPATASQSPQPQSLKTGEAEAWEEPTGLPALPGVLMGIHDPRLEGALQLLLAQQQLRARARANSARIRGPSMPEETTPSPADGSDSETSESEAPRTALGTAAQPQHPRSTGPDSPWKKEIHMVTQDCALDKPLDLSDRGRGRDAPKSAGQALSLSPTVSQSLTPSRPLIQSPQPLSNGIKGTKAPEPKEPSYPLPETLVSLPSPDGTAGESGERPRPASHPQRADTNRHAEPSKAGPQRPESEELEEPDTSDSEVGLGSEAGAKLNMPREGCAGLQQKRKRASDPGDKAFKKPSQGRRKLREPLTADEGSRSLRDTDDHSLSPNNSGQET